MQIKLAALSENIAGMPGLPVEWGLSILVGINEQL